VLRLKADYLALEGQAEEQLNNPAVGIYIDTYKEGD